MTIEQQFHGGVVLINTAEPGAGFGRFHLPITMREMVWQLANGNPCQIPVSEIGKAILLINRYFDEGRIKIEADEKIAQISPHNRGELKLNEVGRIRVGVTA